MKQDKILLVIDCQAPKQLRLPLIPVLYWTPLPAFFHFSDVTVHRVEISKKGKESNAPGKASTFQPLKMLFKSLLIPVYLYLICQTIIKSSTIKSAVVHGPPTSKSPGLLANQVHLTGTY